MLNLNRRAAERKVAVETVSEMFRAMRPFMEANPTIDAGELLQKYLGTVATIFGSACERNKLKDEASVMRAFGMLEPELGRLVHSASDFEVVMRFGK